MMKTMIKTIAILLVSLLLLTTIGVYAAPSADRTHGTKFMKFRADGPKTLMIDGKQLSPDADSVVYGMIRPNGNGRILAFLRGTTEDGELVRLRFYGEISQLTPPDTSVDRADNVYEIVAKSHYQRYRIFGVQTGSNPINIYENGIMELTYNPETNTVNVNSITGDLYRTDADAENTQLGKTNAYNLS